MIKSITNEIRSKIHKDVFLGTQWEAYPQIYWEIYHYLKIKIQVEIEESDIIISQR